MFGTFSLLKKIYGDPVGPVFSYNGDSGIFVLSSENNSYIFSYDYNTTISQIDVINYRIDKGYTFDGNNFYFLNGKNLIKWNPKSLNEEIIYENENMGNNYNYGMFMISDNDIIFSGSEGIAKLNISEKKLEVLRDYGSYGRSSYSSVLNKAIFIEGYTITEMTITDGVIEFKDNNLIKLYPNPAADQITLITEDQNINTIEVFNNLGQKVLTPNMLNNSIDISNLTKGIYFMKLSFQNGETISKKFIKN
jgi:hypothetical protein